MKFRNHFVGAVVAALVLSSGFCRAGETAPAATESAGPTSVTPLMYGLDQTPLGQWMTDQHLNITGYAEAGSLDDLTTPGNIAGQRTLAGDHIAYTGAYKNQIILDQFDLAISRTIDASKNNFDIGFMVEANYGRDAFFNHSNGLLDQNNKHGGGPDDQLDLQQAYLTVGIPVADKLLTIQAGKFDAPCGYESINPTQNQFYTHSYLFTFGIPFTQTGVTAQYQFSDELSAQAGVSRGWNESTDDNNGAIDAIWQVIYKTGNLTLQFDGSFGPEGVPGAAPYGPSDNENYWFVPELIAQYKISPQFNVGIDTLWGFANHYSQWYSAAGYASYTLIDNYLTLNGRLEWYDDGGGLTTGVPNTTSYGEATLGLQIKPFPDDQIFQFLQFRPEIRQDIASHDVFDGKPNQLTIALDAIMQF